MGRKGPFLHSAETQILLPTINEPGSQPTGELYCRRHPVRSERADIPEQRQSLLLQSSNATRTCLRLDDKPVARCGQSMALLALPSVGQHVVTLTDTAGTHLDTHVFEVRELGAKPAVQREK